MISRFTGVLAILIGLNFFQSGLKQGENAPVRPRITLESGSNTINFIEGVKKPNKAKFDESSKSALEAKDLFFSALNAQPELIPDVGSNESVVKAEVNFRSFNHGTQLVVMKWTLFSKDGQLESVSNEGIVYFGDEITVLETPEFIISLR